MKHIGWRLPQQFRQSPTGGEIRREIRRLLFQAENANVNTVSLQRRSEIAHACQRDHGVMESSPIHLPDEIAEHVFGPVGGKSCDDMSDFNHCPNEQEGN
jgi:hypothetical protein